jgi:NAD(P)H dehydrogenase (quinone)
LTRGLQAGGHVYEVVDLYRIGFDPIFNERDYVFFADESIPKHILEAMNWKERMLEASGRGFLGFISKRIMARSLRGKMLQQIIGEVAKHKPKDIVEQQRKVAWADGLVLIAPVIWMHYPAMMKGWLERVFSYGFAYSLTPEGWKGNSNGRVPLLKLRKALSLNTTFFTEEDYQSGGFKDAMSRIIVDWSLKYPGIPDVQLVCLYGVHAVSEDVRGKYLRQAFDLGKEF